MGCSGGGSWGVVHGVVDTLFAMDPSLGEGTWAGGFWIVGRRAGGALCGKGAWVWAGNGSAQ